jgi:hypothetical protein
MKLGVQNFVLNIPTDNSYINVNNNKTKIAYKYTELHKITEFYAEQLSVCTNITSKFRNISIFKSSFKGKND